jgi:hypothetical protein
MARSYREYRAPAGLEQVAACLWENEPAEAREQRVVPDGCVDLIWVADRELVIAGADTGPRIVDLPAGSVSSGIRLRPGAAGALLGLPASELRDLQVPAALVWGERSARLQGALAAAEPARRLELLAGAVARPGVAPDALVVAAAHRLALHSARVADVAAELGVGERRLHRRTLAASATGRRCSRASRACAAWSRSPTTRWPPALSTPATRARRT